MTEFTWTADQQAAERAFCAFFTDPDQSVFVLEGFSGTGKSTLVRHLLDMIPKLEKTARLLNPKHVDREITLTATTNKAAENLAGIANQEVRTIHAVLSLRVQQDYATRQTKIIAAEVPPVSDQIILIDEASYIDSQLLQLIFQRTENCKIMFIGDPAQLLTVGSTKAPVFNAGFPTARLSQVVRQADGNPVQMLSHKFRQTVETGEFFSFVPDGTFVRHLPREQFDQEVVAEFTRPDWEGHASRILAWTNKKVIAYNNGLRELLSGDPQFQKGDYVICNRHLKAGRFSIRTDQTVLISEIHYGAMRHDVRGANVVLDNRHSVFMPDDWQEARRRMNQARAAEDYGTAREIDEEWADLRAAFACTINKSQGSTYDQVFIDLDDIKKCNSGDQIARMLYVGVSRARHHVTLTGDLV